MFATLTLAGVLVSCPRAFFTGEQLVFVKPAGMEIAEQNDLYSLMRYTRTFAVFFLVSQSRPLPHLGGDYSEA